jgi:hypothetical protein
MSLLWLTGCALAILALAFAWSVRGAAGKRGKPQKQGMQIKMAAEVS